MADFKGQIKNANLIRIPAKPEESLKSGFDVFGLSKTRGPSLTGAPPISQHRSGRNPSSQSLESTSGFPRKL
jgi:hypothetical protein